MKDKFKFDFSGFATKVGLKCSDGRVITTRAFKHCDGKIVPLVWQHMHKDPDNILGKAVLEHRDDGVYCYAAFNENPKSKSAKHLVEHGDITELSIYANALQQQGASVMYGDIKEVSLVLAGANPGARIENLSFGHTDGTWTEDDTEVYIYTGLNFTLNHSDELTGQESENNTTKSNLKLPPDDLVLKHAEHAEDATVQEVFDSLDDIQKNVVYAMIAHAIESGGEMEHSNEEGDDTIMKMNVFDQSTNNLGPTLTHDQRMAVLADAKKCGSFKDAMLAHASEYGIENIDILFPDARNIRPTPDMVKRDDDWVSVFLAGCFKTPFSRIKSMSADLTEDEARAKGYITGTKKKEEVFPVMKRVTTPTTVYKKQKLDRDDVVDITDFDVVAWLKVEMRAMLNEELARAALIGDGRDVSSDDKINPLNIRPVWQDNDLYVKNILLPTNTATLDLIDQVVRARKHYRGSGNPNFYSTEDTITDMLLVRDSTGRRIYPTMSDLASALRVANVIAVEVMEDQTRAIAGTTTEVASLIGILLNPKDYTMGADKGGNVSMFEDFDIDYNQQKYLIETRMSGALTKPKSAVTIEKRIAAAAG